MSIGSRIREARISKNMTQPELAEKIGITKGAIANYENEVSVPKHEILFKLMTELGVDANYLYQDLLKDVSEDLILSSEEKELIKNIRVLSEDDKKIVHNLIHRLISTK